MFHVKRCRRRQQQQRRRSVMFHVKPTAATGTSESRALAWHADATGGPGRAGKLAAELHHGRNPGVDPATHEAQLLQRSGWPSLADRTRWFADQHPPTEADEGSRHLGGGRRRREASGDRRRVALPMGRVVPDDLRSLADDVYPLLEPQPFDGSDEESHATLLGVEQCPATTRPGRGDDEARHTSAGTEVDHLGLGGWLRPGRYPARDRAVGS